MLPVLYFGFINCFDEAKFCFFWINEEHNLFFGVCVNLLNWENTILYFYWILPYLFACILRFRLKSRLILYLWVWVNKWRNYLKFLWWILIQCIGSLFTDFKTYINQILKLSATFIWIFDRILLEIFISDSEGMHNNLFIFTVCQNILLI